MFFAAGEDFMGVVFKKTEANETIKDLFLERWNIMRTLSERLYMFVKLQVNLMAHKNPEVDQKEWKEFTVENLPLINEEFIKLSKKVFLHFLDQTIESKQVVESFIEAWDKSTESIMKIKEISQKN